MRRTLCVLLLLSCFPAADCAAGATQVPPLRPSRENPIDVELDACMAKDPSTAGTIRCADRACRAWLESAGRSADEIRPKLDEKGRQSFDAACAAWERFYKGEQRLRESVYGGLLAPEGTMWIVAGTLCVVSFVRERALDLEGADALRRAAPGAPEREKARFDAADAALNREYRALREAIGSGNRQVLQLAQREWIRYRDAEAAFRSDYSHRRDQPFRTLQKALLTESRVRQLRLYLDDLRDAGVARRGDA